MAHISLLSVPVYFSFSVSTKVESTGTLNRSPSNIPPLFTYNKSRNKNPGILSYLIFFCSSLIPLISGCITTTFPHGSAFLGNLRSSKILISLTHLSLLGVCFPICYKTSLLWISSKSASIIALNVSKDSLFPVSKMYFLTLNSFIINPAISSRLLHPADIVYIT